MYGCEIHVFGLPVYFQVHIVCKGGIYAQEEASFLFVNTDTCINK